MLKHLRRGGFTRVFGGSVLSQGILSATSLFAGLLLVRRVPQAQYGYYVLVTTAVPLLAQLQFAFINPILASRITVADAESKRNFVGGLFADQRKFLLAIGIASLLVCAGLWLSGAIRPDIAAIFGLGALAALVWLFREFFRAVLVAYRRPYDVLRGDAIFAVVLISGVFMATFTATPAIFAVTSLVVAAMSGGLMFSRALWRHDPWTRPGTPGMLVQSIRMGAWAATGAIIHWLFSQGYTYLVAARPRCCGSGFDRSDSLATESRRRRVDGHRDHDVFELEAVAHESWSAWTDAAGLAVHARHEHHHGRISRHDVGAARLDILKCPEKDYPQRDLLLGIWSLIFLSTIVRDQVIFLLIAHERWKQLAGLTFICAVLGLTVSFLALPLYGAAGGLMGLLSGEVAHVLGVLLLTVRDMRSEHKSAKEESPQKAL